MGVILPEGDAGGIKMGVILSEGDAGGITVGAVLSKRSSSLSEELLPSSE